MDIKLNFAVRSHIAEVALERLASPFGPRFVFLPFQVSLEDFRAGHANIADFAAQLKNV